MSSPPVSGHGSFEFPRRRLFKGGHTHGSKYTGEWLNSEPHGQGRYEFPSGNFYVGTFRNGLRNGKGVLTWANGDKYEGDYVDDKMHGKGVFTYANGNKYEGDFVNGDFNGKGSFKYKVDGQHSEALGSHSYNAGDVIEGNFEFDKRHGKCTYTFFTGEKLECTFVEGRCPEFDARQADVRAKAKAAAEAKAGAKAVSCHVFDPAARFKSWDAVFIAIGSSSFALGSTVEKAFTRAQPSQQSSFGDKAHQSFALEGCLATAAAELAGRSHIMAVEYPSAPERPKHHFAFDDRLLRDAFVQRLQVC